MGSIHGFPVCWDFRMGGLKVVSRKAHLHSGGYRWEGCRHVGGKGNCVPGSRNRKFKGSEREKGLGLFEKWDGGQVRVFWRDWGRMRALWASVRLSDNNNR